MANFLVRLSNRVKSFFGSPIIFVLSGRIGLDQSPDPVLSNFSTVLKDGTGINDVIVDLTHCEFIYPSMLIFLLSMRDLLEKRGVGFKLALQEGSPVHEYLLFCGFSKFFEMPEFPAETPKSIDPKSEVYAFQEGSSLGDTYKIAQDIIDLLKSQQPLSPQVESTAIDSIYEILRNVAQHSGYSRYLILGQSYPKSKRIRFVIHDNGIGIKAHITQKPYEQTHPYFRKVVSEDLYEELKMRPANLAIEEAAKYMVSGTDYVNNSGAGLDFLINKLTVPTNGIVSILSGDGYVKWVAGKITESRSIGYYSPGTLVSVTINCNSGSILKYKREEV